MVLPGQLGGRVGRRRVIFEKAVRFRGAGQPLFVPSYLMIWRVELEIISLFVVLSDGRELC